MSDFTELLDLAAERLGGRAVVANDEFFAERENLLKAAPPIFLPHEYSPRGKWMDGWETRRRREPGHDFCIIRLGVCGIVRGVVVDTAFFKGNYPEQCSIDAAAVEGYPSADELGGSSIEWTEILPPSRLAGDSPNRFAIESPYAFDHLRLNIFPDGGVARLRVHGEPVIRFGRLPVGEGLVDLAAAVHGAEVVSCSDMFFGVRHNLIMPGEARNMGEGWETRRRRGPGNDWALVRLARPGIVRRVEVDTSHFKGNAPKSCLLEATQTELSVPSADAKWWPVLASPLRPDTRHFFIDEVDGVDVASHVRLNVYPDGGIARLRVYGEITSAERVRAGVRWLNTLPPSVALGKLRACCGSRSWARKLEAARPFADAAVLAAAADRAWSELGEAEKLEAFSAHPRIGEKKAGNSTAARFSASEQKGTGGAADVTLAELAKLNQAYEEKFGFVFLICATGKSADQMLASLRERISHSRADEIRIAAEEQANIMHLRIERLLSS